MSSPETASKIWHNGKFVNWENANIHVMSHVIHYASSVFEGIRCYSTPNGPAIFRLKEHIQRLKNSAYVFRMELDYTVDELVQATLHGFLHRP